MHTPHYYNGMSDYDQFIARQILSVLYESDTPLSAGQLTACFALDSLDIELEDVEAVTAALMLDGMVIYSNNGTVRLHPTHATIIPQDYEYALIQDVIPNNPN